MHVLLFSPFLTPCPSCVPAMSRCDRVIIPVHQGLHWTALMVDIKQQRLVFFDSLFGKNAKAVAAVRRWVADEAQVGPALVMLSSEGRQTY